MTASASNRLLLSSVAALLLSTSCVDPASQLPDYGRVPHFQMRDSAGQNFDSDALSGNVWVADFIYTNCPAECPRMTSQMRRVESKVRADADVRLVSISVDPDRDTPAVLQTFAEKFGGPTKQWVFLTGSPETVHELAFNTFHVGDLIGKMEHSTKFVLVDKKGKIRGYVSTFDADGLPNLMTDLNTLRRARSRHESCEKFHGADHSNRPLREPERFPLHDRRSLARFPQTFFAYPANQF